jgi:mannan endo-1,4-beta-mannosidase
LGRRQLVLPPRVPRVCASLVETIWYVAQTCQLTEHRRSERLQVLDAIQAADLKVLRLFISETFENFKNTGSVYMPDIEPEQVGLFEDTQLEAIDQLMVEAHERGKHDISSYLQLDADPALV